MGTSDRRRPVDVLASTPVVAGTSGAAAGALLHVAGAVGGVWPLVAVGLGGAAAALTQVVRRAAPRSVDPALEQAAVLASTITRLRTLGDVLPDPLASGLVALLAAADDAHRRPSDHLARAEVLGFLEEVEGALVRYGAVAPADRRVADPALAALLRSHRLAVVQRIPEPATALDELTAYLRAVPVVRPGSGSGGSA